MLSNPNVSLLAHDWISLKSEDKKQDQAPSRRNSLYELLANINKNELNRVSVMLNGKAEIVGREDQKFDFFNGLHLNNPKIEESQVKNYIECEHNALVVIKIDTCKVTDTELLRPEQNEQLKALVRAINYLLLLSFTILAIFIVIINSSGAFNKTEQKTYNDRLLVLDKGQVAEFDTPENLLKNKEGIFYSLCEQGGWVKSK